MKIILVVLGYLKWHYGKALKSLSGIWKNFFIFIINFFSLKYLVLNFLDPWKRMSDPYPHTFNFKDYLFAFITNMITRLVGMIMRLLLLIIGTGVAIIFCLLLPVFLLLWLSLPLIVIFLMGQALYLIIK